MSFVRKRNPALELFVILLIAGTASGLASCSTDSTRAEQDSSVSAPRADALANAVGARDRGTLVTEVRFERGSSQLDAADKARLDELVNTTSNNGKVDQIKLIGWADLPYPAKAKQSLPEAQQKLAAKRMAHIQDYLKHFDRFENVDTFNMAQKPAKMSEWFKTESARVKQTLASAGVSDTPADKTGKALVLVILKESSKE